MRRPESRNPVVGASAIECNGERTPNVTRRIPGHEDQVGLITSLAWLISPSNLLLRLFRSEEKAPICWLTMLEISSSLNRMFRYCFTPGSSRQGFISLLRESRSSTKMIRPRIPRAAKKAEPVKKLETNLLFNLESFCLLSEAG